MRIRGRDCLAVELEDLWFSKVENWKPHLQTCCTSIGLVSIHTTDSKQRNPTRGGPRHHRRYRIVVHLKSIWHQIDFPLIRSIQSSASPRICIHEQCICKPVCWSHYIQVQSSSSPCLALQTLKTIPLDQEKFLRKTEDAFDVCSRKILRWTPNPEKRKETNLTIQQTNPAWTSRIPVNSFRGCSVHAENTVHRTINTKHDMSTSEG